MPLPDQANYVARPIDNHGKEIHDVAAKNAQIEGVGLRECSERTLEGNRGSAAERQPNVRSDSDRQRRAADAAELLRSRKVRKGQRRQNPSG